jgi:hypothetical protein
MFLNLLFMCILGALTYNIIAYGDAAFNRKKGWQINGNKIARTGCAGLIQFGLWCACVSIWPQSAIGILPASVCNAIMVNGFAAFGLDRLIRIVWK